MTTGTTYVSESLHALSGALAEFYAPGLTAGSFVERAFAFTSSLLRFDLNSHGVLDVESGVLTADFDVALPGLAEAFGAFGRHMAKYEPFRFDPACNQGKPFSARDFYSQPALEDLDIYEDVYRPMRLVDHGFVHVPAPAGEVVFLGFLRGGRPFDADEKALLALLQPHLGNGRALARAVTAAERRPPSPELFARLGFTPRESDVLFWLTRGETTDQIARELGLRSDSVRRHLHAIYGKLGVDHRAAATLRAIELAHRAIDEADHGRAELRFRVDTRP